MDADVMPKVLIRYLFVALVCSGCENMTEYMGVFSDGLPEPTKATIETFIIPDYELKKIQKQKSHTICDVRYLL